MRRRDLLVLAAGAAARPAAVRAQPAAMPLVGFINSGTPAGFARSAAAFRAGLRDAGFVEGQSVAVEYRWAEGDYDRLPAMAAELVARGAAVIAATGASWRPVVLDGRAIVGRTPIVVVMGSDPVRSGLVASFSRPGGTVTGVAMLTAELMPKRLDLLHEAVPAAAAIAVLMNPSNASVAQMIRTELPATAASLGVRLMTVEVAGDAELEPALAASVRDGAQALLVGADPLFSSRIEPLIALARRHRLPAMYEWRDFVEAGGLMSYGPVLADAYRQAGAYVGQILRGASPADLPVVRPTRFELCVHLATARALGTSLPASFLAHADEVIE
jgi:putative ABC transport system substrate-binding protein